MNSASAYAIKMRLRTNIKTDHLEEIKKKNFTFLSMAACMSIYK